MAKTFVKTLMGVALLLAFVSCATNHYVWDDELPTEETVTLVFSPSKNAAISKVDSYNGINPADWKNPTAITIPAGDTELGVSASLTLVTGYGYNVTYTTTYKGEDMLFSYTYEPGKTYYLAFNRENGVWGVQLYSSHWARKDQKLDFVPFSNIKNDE